MAARVPDLTILELRKWCRDTVVSMFGGPAVVCCPSPAALDAVLDELQELRSAVQARENPLFAAFASADSHKINLLRSAADRLRELGDQDDLVLQIDELVVRQDAVAHRAVIRMLPAMGFSALSREPKYEYVCAVPGCPCRGTIGLLV